MADMQPQPPQQGVQQVKIISSGGGGGSGSRPLQMMSNVTDGGSRPSPIILNASPAGVQIQSSPTPVMISGGGQSPSVAATSPVIMQSPGQGAGSPSSPPIHPAPAAAASPAGITIRSSAGAGSSPSYNGPAVGQAPTPGPTIQPQPVAIRPAPAPQIGGGPIAVSSGVIRIGGSAVPSSQVYGPPQPSMVNQPTAVVPQPLTAVDQTVISARSPGQTQAASAKSGGGTPRLTPDELLSKADPLWVCGFLLAIFGVAFATMAFEGEVSTTWLLLFVSAASVGAFVKLQL